MPPAPKGFGLSEAEVPEGPPKTHLKRSLSGSNHEGAAGTHGNKCLISGLLSMWPGILFPPRVWGWGSWHVCQAGARGQDPQHRTPSLAPDPRPQPSPCPTRAFPRA